jgi:hypothetical protein
LCQGYGELMTKSRFFFISLLSALVLLNTINHTVDANDLGTINTPISSVTAEVINCKLTEGWCSKGPYLLITGEDPAYTILAIEGSTNGVGFHVDGKTCSIPLNVGANELVFWSLSSSGVPSAKKFLTINLTANQPRSLINSDPARKTQASGLSGSQLQVDVSNELKDPRYLNQMGLFAMPEALSKPMAEPPVIQSEAFDPQDFLKISPAITNYFLQQNLNGQKNTSILQDIGKAYNLVLDTLPPRLNILPRKSNSGVITFEGNTADEVSGINALMVNFGQGWLPVRLEEDHWSYQWNTEKAGISGGVFDLQVRVEDKAGNQQIQTQRVTVINTIWPVLALCGLVLALGFTALVDPRRKAWSDLAQVTARAARVMAMNSRKAHQ